MILRRSVSVMCLCVVAAGVFRMALAQDGRALQDKFREVDANRDGRIDAKELTNETLFKELDANSDGGVTLEEARSAFQSGILTRETIQSVARKSVPAPVPDPSADSGIKQAAKILKPAEHGVCRFVSDCEFTDIFGAKHLLSGFSSRKAVVIAMTSTSCPISRKLLPTLADLAKSYNSHDVQFVAVNCVPTDKMADMVSASETLGMGVIYVHDEDENFARHLQALSTTDVFVLDAARTVVYHGAIDDQYGIGFSRDAASQHFLKDAITAVLAGKTPEIAATAAPGCTLDLEAGKPTDNSVTYHRHISRIVAQNCLDCHRSAGVGPFPLETYQDIVAHAGMIRQVVDNKTMPPWFAAGPSGHAVWANDRSLTDIDRSTLVAWLDSSRPEGDPNDGPLPRTFAGEWTYGTPDYVIQLPEPVKIKATGTMPYQFITAKTTLSEDKWVQGYEILPTDRSVVHHVIVNVHNGGRIVNAEEGVGGYWAAYVPGNSGQMYPKGFARKLPAGATMSFQIHYTPNGTVTQDQLQLGVFFADAEPKYVVDTIALADRNLSIPPNEANHLETLTRPVPADINVLAYMAHMHVRGKSFRFDLTKPDGTKETLLDIPNYDFNWQLRYDYAEPRVIPKGSRVTVSAVFDNSDQNPANPDPNKTVRWGQQTYDEMMIGYVETYAPVGSDPASARRQMMAGGARFFSLLDGDGNGSLSRDEGKKAIERAPEQLRDRAELLDRLFDRMDADKSGELSQDEFEKLRALLGRR